MTNSSKSNSSSGSWPVLSVASSPVMVAAPAPDASVESLDRLEPSPISAGTSLAAPSDSASTKGGVMAALKTSAFQVTSAVQGSMKSFAAGLGKLGQNVGAAAAVAGASVKVASIEIYNAVAAVIANIGAAITAGAKTVGNLLNLRTGSETTSPQLPPLDLKGDEILLDVDAIMSEAAAKS